MKRFILILACAVSTFGATQMKIENGVLVNQLDANSQKIINLAVPTNPSEAANKSYVDSAVGSGGGGTGLPIMGGHAGQALFTDGLIAFWQLVPWASISGKPTTLAGYGITDPIVLTTGSYANPSWISSIGWAKISGTPTTLGGYGIATPLPITAIPTGTSSGTVAIGNDSRFSANVTGLRKSSGNGSTDVAAIPGTDYVVPGTAGAGDVISNTTTSVTGEIATFADTTGKLVGRSTGTGIATLNAGVLGSTASVGATQGGTAQTTVATGDILYGSATNTWSRLAGVALNGTNKYLRSVGTGLAAQAPTWQQVQFSDLSSIPTTLSGYGITDAQPLDGDLTSIAAISATGVIPYRSAANTWGTVTIGTGLNFVSGTLSATGGTGAGDVTGPSSSSDSEIAIFSGTTGKTLKRASATVSGTGIPKISSGVLSMATANVDYAKVISTTLSGGTVTIIDPTINRVILVLISPLVVTLPSASSYPNGNFIEFVDLVGGSSTYSVTIQAATGETIDGGSQIIPPKGFTYLRINSTGSAWSTSQYYVTKLQDPNDVTKTATFDLSGLSGPRSVGIADGTSSTALTSPGGGPDDVLRFFDASPTATGGPGHFTAGPLFWGNIHSNSYTIDSSAISSNTATVTNDGSIDTVNLTATLAAPLTVNWPSAAFYGANERVKFYDKSGTLTSTNSVLIKPQTGETINGSTSGVTVQEQFATRELLPDGVGSWQVSPGPGTVGSGGATIAWGNQLTEDTTNHTITWNCVSGLPVQTAYCVLTGNDTLVVNNPEPGMLFRLIVKQDATGSRTLSLNYPAMTASGGAGVLNIASAANAVTLVNGLYSGVTGIHSVWNSELNFTAGTAPVVSCSNPGDTYASGGTGQQGIATGSSTLYVATASFIPTSGNTSVCRIDIPIYKDTAGGSPTGDLKCRVYNADGATNPNAGGPLLPGTQIGTDSNIILAANITATTASAAAATPLQFTWNTPLPLSTSGTYWVVVYSNAAGTSTKAYHWVATTGQPTGYKAQTSSNGTTWVNGAGNFKLNFTTYH